MGRYGMAGDHYRQSGYVTLQDVPDPNREYTESFRNLVGGMNRFDLDFQLKGNETPFCQNLSWHDGALNSRWGQTELPLSGAKLGNVITCAPFLFHGWMLVQTKTIVFAVKLQHESGEPTTVAIGTVAVPTLTAKVQDDFPDDPDVLPPPLVYPSVGEDLGSFVRYRENAIFKNHGHMIVFGWDENTDAVTVYDVTHGSLGNPTAFVPTIQINSDPDTGAGDQFQQENRLCAWKKVTYNAKSGISDYFLPVSGVTVVRAKVDGVVVPVTVSEVVPSGATEPQTQVHFQTAPPVTDPPTNNTVEIWYRKQNTDAMNSILNSRAISVFGGAQDLCVVIGGPDAQPNAYFWSGNNGLVMDPTYFPMNQYNLAGENSDPITCFGKQQNMLTIFQTGATGRCVFGTETINGVVEITMNYTRINAEIGCDLPGSLQLVENNLVWCNRRHGVCRLKDSSAAYENNIVVISRKINGDYSRQGLLQELERVEDTAVRSADTGRKYMLVVDENVTYEWNYELSEYQNPSWFFHKGIKGVGFVPEDNDALYEVTVDGKVAQFMPVFMDFEQPIEKIYRLPPRNFGSYDRLKNIMSVIFTTRGDANTNTEVTYFCDYGNRKDATNLVSHHWCLVPRNLARRDLSSPPYSSVFRRKPGYHNIRHLEIQLYNNEAGVDLSIVSADIFYTFRGRQR